MYVVPDQNGKLAIFTGANSGTGKEAIRRLAAPLDRGRAPHRGRPTRSCRMRTARRRA
jgi:hypothetical protein